MELKYKEDFLKFVTQKEFEERNRRTLKHWDIYRRARIFVRGFKMFRDGLL